MKLSFATKNLLIYLAALIAGIVFASFYGGPVAYAPLTAIALLLPVSVIYILVSFKLLRVYQEIEVHKLTKGEVHKYRAVFENAGIFPIHNMAVGVYKDRCNLYEIPEGSRISLDAHEKKELFSGINCLFAGAYYIGVETLTFSDPFHILEMTFDVSYSFRALVKPRITDIAGKALDLENLINSTGQKSYRLYEDTPGNDLRVYQKGDSLSSVNWKVSAKLSDLMVRIPDRMEKRRLTIIMNACNIPEREWDTEFLKGRDFFLEFVVSAARHFSDQGIPVTIIYPAGKIVEARIDSRDSFNAFYESVSDGLFYSSDGEYKKLQEMITIHKETGNNKDTWITINEQPKDKDNFIDIYE